MMLLNTENDGQRVYPNETIKLGAPGAPGALEVYYLILCQLFPPSKAHVDPNNEES